MNPEQLAINSVSTRHSSLEEALDAYSDAGFRNVEFVLGQVKEWLKGDHGLDDLRSLLRERNLRSIGGFETGLACFGPPEAREANHRQNRENARLIHELGGGTLVVGTDGPEQPGPEAFEVMGEVFRHFAESLEGMDVQVAIEFNWSPFIKSLKSAVRVAEAADHPKVGVLFDPAHYHCTSSKLEHMTPEAVRWIKHCHFNDMRDKPGEISDCNGDRVLPGRGILPLREMIRRLEEGGYRGYCSIEMFNAELWETPVREAAVQCYRSMLPYCS